MKKGFTLAEVLITLAIIGVVAAISIPTIITNYQKKQYVTQLKKVYTSLNNGFHQVMAREGVTDLTNTKMWTGSSAVFSSEFKKAFNVTDATLDKIIKYKDTNKKGNILDREEGYEVAVSLITFEFGPNEESPVYDEETETWTSRLEWLKTYNNGSGFVFQFQDGAIIDIREYNHNDPKTFTHSKCNNTSSGGNGYCMSLKEFQSLKESPTHLWKRAGKVFIDVNGFKKGPNAMGRDAFVYEIGSDGTLYPVGGPDEYMFNSGSSTKYSTSANRANQILNIQDIQDPECYDEDCPPAVVVRDYGCYDKCAAVIMRDGWQMKY